MHPCRCPLPSLTSLKTRRPGPAVWCPGPTPVKHCPAVPPLWTIPAKAGGCRACHASAQVILPSNPTIEQFCNKLHRNMIKTFKHAWVWGSSVKHNPQKVGKDHVLRDEDIVQIVKKN